MAARRSKSHRDRRRRECGFTLLELLLAISILALMFALLAGGVRFGVAAWEKGSTLGKHTAELRTAHRLIRRQIERSRPVRRPDRREERHLAFVGDADGLRFVAPPPAHLSEPGVYLIRLSIEAGARGKRLIMAWRRLQPDYSDFAEDGEMESVILADRLADGAISYFGRLDDEEDGRWHRRWAEAAELPRLVKISLRYPDAERRQWPDLVAAPQVRAMR